MDTQKEYGFISRGESMALSERCAETVVMAVNNFCSLYGRNPKEVVIKTAIISDHYCASIARTELRKRNIGTLVSPSNNGEAGDMVINLDGLFSVPITCLKIYELESIKSEIISNHYCASIARTELRKRNIGTLVSPSNNGEAGDMVINLDGLFSVPITCLKIYELES